MTQLKIVGTATCSFGVISQGHDGDSARANRLDNGGVFCVFCGIAGPSTFDALINGSQPGTTSDARIRIPGGYTPLTCLRDGSYDPAPTGLTGLAARASGPNTQRIYQANYRDGGIARLTFDDGDFDREADESIGSEFNANDWKDAPASVQSVANALTAVGYRITNNAQIGRLGDRITIVLLRGAHINGDPTKMILGPKVELSYTV